MNKMKSLVQYHYSQFIKPLVISYSIFFVFSMGLMLSLMNINTSEFGVSPTMFLQADIYGLNMISWILMGIIASTSFVRGLNHLIQNGFTRRQTYISKIIAIFALAITMSLLSFMTERLQTFLFFSASPKTLLQTTQYHLVLVLVYFMIGLAFTFFAIIVNKFGRRKSIIFYIGFFIGVRLLETIRTVFLSSSQQQWIMDNIFFFIPQGQLAPTYIFIPLTIVAVLITGLSYIMVKRTDITAQ